MVKTNPTVKNHIVTVLNIIREAISTFDTLHFLLLFNDNFLLLIFFYLKCNKLNILIYSYPIIYCSISTCIFTLFMQNYFSFI